MNNSGKDSRGLTLRTIFMTRAALDASISLEAHCLCAGLQPAEAAHWLSEYADREFWIDIHSYLSALIEQEAGTAIEIILKDNGHRIFNTAADISRLPRSRIQIQNDLDASLPF